MVIILLIVPMFIGSFELLDEHMHVVHGYQYGLVLAASGGMTRSLQASFNPRFTINIILLITRYSLWQDAVSTLVNNIAVD